MSNLQLRIISALVLAAAVLAITWFGGLPFRVLAAAIGGAIFYEWSRMARQSSADAGGQGLLAQLADGFVLVFAVAIVIDLPALLLIGLALLLTIVLAVLAKSRAGSPWEAPGFAYAALSALSIALLRGDGKEGLIAILFLFAVVWATDIFAYFVGRAIGGPKLAPSISPGKTRSGAVGGMVAGVIAGLLVGIAAGLPGLWLLGSVAALLSIVSQAGDLFESWVKRRHGVKDSGWIIPGHGGVMDRVDGLVAAAFALYVIGWALGDAGHPALGLFAG
ncbi:phosphatidate cytidylyltransferase [Mesorhizobium sp. LHD-90]|uniref:phosphatidate cytidylyltransferase n=1 Tax=Mesorhizobium sp. LHD-90 TaxID=3071414 RepID=UPI0027DF38A0|nr:phosphatidate cytidylyltransferase [Mesorhizobium sp. LHD-90]MDQ6437131.1 phosphatidate cytidylyltransferase [Mesorhizobium sp. LHD-90]